MIKVFTTNKDGKVELTTKELKEILDEAYWEGYKANNLSWTYNTPNWKPYVCTTNGTNTTITLNAEDIKSGTCTGNDCSIKSDFNSICARDYGIGVSVSGSSK